MHARTIQAFRLRNLLHNKRLGMVVIAAIVCIGGIGAAAYFRFRKTPTDYRKLTTAQLRSITTSHPAPAAFLALFQRVYDANDRDEALKIAREMVRQFPSDARGHNILGIAYAANQDPESARKAFNNSIALNPHSVDPYVNLGRLSLLIGDNQKAIHEFDLATVVEPKSASAWTGLGEANAKVYNAPEAREAFQHAIQLAPNRPQAYSHLGVFQAEAGNGDKARPNLNRAFELGDRSGSLYAGLAMAYADQPQSPAELSKALEYAKKAQELGDHGGMVYYAEGLALQRLNRYKEAIVSFRKVISVSDNANGAWIGISQCYRALGKTKLADEAARTGERVLSQRQQILNLKHEIGINPERIDLREKYGDVLVTNGQYILAAEQYRYVAMHSPGQTGFWLKAAHAFELGGETDLAAYVRQFANEKPIKTRGANTQKSKPAGKAD